MTRSELLNTNGKFLWNHADKFFIETVLGNFIWSDPDMGGSNSLFPYGGTFLDWNAKANKNSLCRDKGTHVLKDFCGADVITYGLE